MTRILGVDPGTRRVGLAISDPSGMIAQPLETLAAEDEHQLVSALRRLIAQYEVDEIVVGLAKSLNGELGPAAQRGLHLAALLRTSVACPVHMLDERLTTAQAERSLLEAGLRRSRRRQTRDQAAAALLLQAYLDGQRTTTP